MSDKVDIAELRRLLEKASRQPWSKQSVYRGTMVRSEAFGITVCRNVVDSYAGRNDAALIVAAVNALPQLLAAYERCERLEEVLAELLGYQRAERGIEDE